MASNVPAVPPTDAEPARPTPRSCPDETDFLEGSPEKWEFVAP